MDTYSISKRDSERLDFARILFALMVVYIHSSQGGVNLAGGSVAFDTPQWLTMVKSFFSDVLPRCAVPGFFLISGVLLFRKPFSWRENMEKKWIRLAVPYLLLNTFWILFYLVCQSLPVVSGFFSKDRVVDWSFAQWLDAYTGFRSGEPLAYHLWFLRDLFVMNLAAPIIGCLMKRVPNLTALAVVLPYLFWSKTRYFGITVEAVCFFTLGAWVANQGIHFQSFRREQEWCLGALYLASLPLALLSQSVTVKRFSILLGVVFWLVCVTELPPGAFWKKLMPCALDIYLFHQMTMTIFFKIVNKVIPPTTLAQLLEYLLMPVVMVVFCVCLRLFLKRFLPGGYGLLTGNRQKAAAEK